MPLSKFIKKKGGVKKVLFLEKKKSLRMDYLMQICIYGVGKHGKPYKVLTMPRLLMIWPQTPNSFHLEPFLLYLNKNPKLKRLYSFNSNVMRQNM